MAGLCRYADLVLAAPWQVPELPPVAEGQQPPHILIAVVEDGPVEPSTDWTHRWQAPSGMVDLRLGRLGGDYLLKFPGLADFVIDGEGASVAVWVAPESSLETLRHLLLDQVMPRVLAHRGRLVVHAGAVRAGDVALGFVGEAGSGKSTLAASMGQRGHVLLTDDGLVLSPDRDRVIALPTYPGLRLWPDAVEGLFPDPPPTTRMAHYSSKRRVTTAVDDNGPEPLPLAALFFLEPATSSVELEALTPREACMALVANSFQLDPTDLGRAADQLAAAATVAERVRMFRLRVPRGFARLPDVHDAVLAACGSDAGSTPGRSSGLP